MWPVIPHSGGQGRTAPRKYRICLSDCAARRSITSARSAAALNTTCWLAVPIPMRGIGPITASALVATVENEHDLRNGRQVYGYWGMCRANDPQAPRGSHPLGIHSVQIQCSNLLRTALWHT
jgi:hypothetical protein